MGMKTPHLALIAIIEHVSGESLPRESDSESRDERIVSVDFLRRVPDPILGSNEVKVREQVEEDLEVEIVALRGSGEKDWGRRAVSQMKERTGHGRDKSGTYEIAKLDANREKKMKRFSELRKRCPERLADLHTTTTVRSHGDQVSTSQAIQGTRDRRTNGESARSEHLGGLRIRKALG
jgi:hypothetical protein